MAPKKSDTPKWTAAVPIWKVFGKAQTRAWADENGMMILSEGKSGKRYFVSDKVKELLTPETSYLMKARI